MSGHGGGGHEEEHAGGDERWLVSYSDFITLLFVLFVVLYSISQVDVTKYKILAESMRAAFSTGTGGNAGVINSSIGTGGGGTDPNSQTDPIVVPGMPQKAPDSESVADQLSQMLKSMNVVPGISVQNNIEGELISLSESIVFTPGTTSLQPQAYPVLDNIMVFLNTIPNEIRIVGHTDDTLSSDPKYSNDIELSVGRAIVVADYLINAGLDPSRVSISGKGQYDPIFSNDSEEHRVLNGRTDIVVIYPDSTSLVTTTQ